MTFRAKTLTGVMILGLLCNALGQEVRIRRDAPRPQRFTTEDVLAGTGLPTWTGSFTHSGTTYTYVMVGTDPSKGSATTTVPVAIIPLKLTFSDGTVFDASGPLYQKTASATQAVLHSPIFRTVDFTAGAVDLGVTQFIDAFQRGNFWSSVSTVSPDYHVLLRPVVAPVQSFNVPASGGHTISGPFGTKRGILNGSYIDQNITGPLFNKFQQITPGVFTIFLTYNVFPAGAYGYHDVYGNSPATGKTYSYVSYLDPYTQLIDADISTLAHEVAEWMDDAYINNNTPCGILEVGDALSDVIFEVNEGGFVWHPQDLAFLGYFSFEPSQSVNGWLTFRNTFSQPCQ
jgi:hypothetical protein